MGMEIVEKCPIRRLHPQNGERMHYQNAGKKTKHIYYFFFCYLEGIIEPIHLSIVGYMVRSYTSKARIQVTKRRYA